MSRRGLSLAAGVMLAFGLVGGGSAATLSPAPTVFAPGVVSATSGVSSPTFTPDGNTVYFEQQVWPNDMIMVSHRGADGAWSVPRIAPFSGQWHDHDPALSPDGSYMIFTSYRPDTPGGQPPAHHGAHLWRVDRRGEGWGTPVLLPAVVNSVARVVVPSVAANGNLYFQRKDATDGAYHLYVSAYRGGEYQVPVRLPFGDARAHQIDATVAPDESFIVFDADYAGADKPDRLYIAFHEGDHWGRPIDFGDALNSYQPWGAAIGPAGRTLYFTSNHVTKVNYPRSREQARADLARMRAWDNGSNHIWSIPLTSWLDAHHTERHLPKVVAPSNRGQR